MAYLEDSSSSLNIKANTQIANKPKPIGIITIPKANTMKQEITTNAALRI